MDLGERQLEEAVEQVVAGEPASAAPHALQNRLPGSTVAPQVGHPVSREVPHCRQK